MGIGPAPATRRALQLTGMTLALIIERVWWPIAVARVDTQQLLDETPSAMATPGCLL
jgi:hypothetical protein